MNAPFLPSARNNHGAILLRLGRTAQATAQFEASLKLDPNQPSALINLAQIHSDAGTPGQLNRARELFSRAQAIAPDLSVARALVAIALRLGDAAAAKGYYRDYQSLAAATSAAAPSGTDGASSHAALGAALLSAGLAGEAVVELTAAHALAPTDTDVIVRLASAHLAQGDVPAAGRTLEAAVARGLDTAPIYAALAEVYVKSDHIENAIPAMRLAIERDPKNETYRFRYGMLLTDTKAPAAAVIRLQEALQEFPGSSRLWFALGVAQTALDKPEEAAKSFERARELDPKFAPALAYLGMTYDHQGRYADAVRLYEQALKLDDRLAAAHYLAAEATLKQPSANTASAEAHLARAVSLDPSFAPARLSLAKLYLAADRMDEAIVHLQSAVATDPNLAEAHYHLGRALKRLKRDAESQVALATFKRLSEEKREQKRNEPREIMRRLANVRF
ncbi:MAG TPA: tetratricopeptide repeat protein, partial [Pyrinomonadaceae bacterium]|nr:tetratricopeptide repeat protein [Pyrinomonadaceae bacterium]